MRAFIAIELPEAVRRALYDFRELLRRKGMHASWVKPEAMHLTLRFLGDITEEQAQTFSSFVSESYMNLAAPVLLVRGIGAFPSLKKPNILWAGVETVQGNLDVLQQAAEFGARGIGLVPETKKFHPILRCAIQKNGGQPFGIQHIMPYMGEQIAPEFGYEFRASNVVLFSSTLTKTGPIYKKLREFPLL